MPGSSSPSRRVRAAARFAAALGLAHDHRRPLTAVLALAAVVLPLLTIFWPPLAEAIGGSRVYPDFLGLRYATYYVAPMTVAAPLWVCARLHELPELSPRRLALDALVFTISATRSVPVVALTPLSGHALFLSYTALTTRDRRYVVLAFAGLAGTTWIKLVEWRDPFTWAIGLALGVALALAFHRGGAPRTAARA